MKKQAIQSFRLTTVTYGIKTAPYLAVRSIQQLAHDVSSEYPTEARILLKDSYVDEIYTCNNSLADSIALRDQLIEILGEAGMELSKWASNNKN